MGIIETGLRNRIVELVDLLDPMTANPAIEKELEQHLRLLRLFDRDESARVDQPSKPLRAARKSSTTSFH